MPLGVLAPEHDARAWELALRPYRRANGARSAYELAATAIPFAAIAWMMLWAVDNGHYLLYALLLLPQAGLLVRLFVIQHDCAHYSFLRRRWANDWLGRLIGVATLTPHDHWRVCHAIHHASSGNLDRRGIGDVHTLTVAEYLARAPWGRLTYRLYRHPAVTFGIGPLYVFLVRNRLPVGFMRDGWKHWLSTMGTNVGVVAAVAAIVALVGLRSFLWMYVPVVIVAATAGVWLFYVQHQFEKTHWVKDEVWKARVAALYGSSHYRLPAVMRWFTANIGVHHVHHLSSGIPFYRLPEVMRDHPALRDVGTITVRESLRAAYLALWDENQHKLISFAQLR